MLSIDQCKKYLQGTYPDEKIIELKDNIYQIGALLVENYFSRRATLLAT